MDAGQAGPCPATAARRPTPPGWLRVTATDGCWRSCPPRPATSPPPKTPSRTPSSALCAAGLPRGCRASPDAWLLTVARNRLRDHWRSAEAQRTVPLDGRPDSPVHSDDLDVEALPDKRLELMLVCAHPAIDRSAHTPLMLATVLGFTAEQIGRAFSVPASTMATRRGPGEEAHQGGAVFRFASRTGRTSRRGWTRSWRRSTARMSSTGRRPDPRTASCPRTRCCWPRC